jgi:ubiquinone/menaquinone biosynthesis C-methylase UbiE
VWSDDIDGFVYEYAARSTNPTFADNTEIFRRLAQTLSGRPSRRILDMGCGFGKTTAPLAEEFSGAEVVGIDLAAPCLKVAWLRAAQRGLPITYLQRNAERTHFADDSFDLVTAHQLLHEVPRPALRRILREAFRILRDGGQFVVLDFHSPGGPFATFIHYGHARRNREVYMRRFDETDLRAEYGRVGFIDFSMVPFGDDLGHGRADDGTRAREWRFPWKLISATKPPGEGGSRA